MVSDRERRSPEAFERHKVRRKKLMRRKRQDDPIFKAMEAERMRNKRASDPEKYREVSNRCKAKARKERPHLHRNQWLKWAYGMSLEEYEGKLAAQGGVCLTCGGNNKGKPLVVDHDHSKPKGEGNRGLLCNGCNIAIGAVMENSNVLRKIADMLEGYSGARYCC